MADCCDSRRTHRIGCGATYRGNQAHCVAKAPWSTHPDGLCHATFSTPGTVDLHWIRGVHVDPAIATHHDVLVLRQDERGIWHSAERRPDLPRATDGGALGATQTVEMGTGTPPTLFVA